MAQVAPDRRWPPPMTHRDLANWVQAAERVLPIPAVLARVVTALDDEGSDLSDIATVVATDPGLVAVLLRVANSAAVAPPRTIDSVLDALVLLGRDGVRRAIISGVLSTALNQRQIDHLPLDAYWRVSLYAAVLAQQLAEHLPSAQDGDATNLVGEPSPTSRSAPALAFLAGLLHGLGTLIVYSVDAPAAHALALDQIAQTPAIRGDGGSRPLNSPLAEARLGAMPTAIGGAVAQAWRLPAAIVAAIQHHTCPSADDVPRHWLIDVTHVAHVLAHLSDIDSRDLGDAPPADPAAFARLGLRALLTGDDAVLALDTWLAHAEMAYRRAETLRGGRFATDDATG